MSRSITLSFHLVWLVCMAIVLYIFLRYDALFSPERISIAHLVEKSGKVRLRYKDLNLWNPVEEDQAFYKNEILSTGDQAEAYISFDGESVLKLGQNSQLLIQENRQSKDMPILVTLFRGKIETLNEKAAQEKLKDKNLLKTNNSGSQKKLGIKTGDKVIELETKKTELSISKTLKQDAVIDIKSGDIEVKDAEKSEESEPEILLIKNPEDHPKDQILPQFLGFNSGDVFWFPQSIYKLSGPVPLTFKFNPHQENLIWTPLFAFGSKKQKFNSTQNSQVSINSAITQEHAQLDSSLEYTAYYLDLHYGYRLSTDSDPQKSTANFFSADPLQIGLRSFEDLPKTSVSIQFFNLPNPRNARVQKQYKQTPLKAKKALFKVDFISSALFKKTASLLATQSQFKISARSQTSGTGTFITDNKRILAKLTSSKALPALTQYYKKRLRGKLVFSGKSKSLFIPGSYKSFVNYPWQKLRTKTVYALKGKKLVPVNKNMLKKVATKRLIFKTSKVFFTEKVKIISSDFK